MKSLAMAPLGALCGAAYLVGGDRLGHWMVRHRGPVVTLPILGFGTVALVADPALAKQVLLESPRVLLGGEGVGPAAAIYGSGSMFVQEEPEHVRRRRLLTPPLQGNALQAYVPIIERATLEAMATWPAGRPLSLLAASRDLMLDVIVRVVFGVIDDAEVRRIGRPFKELLDLGLSEATTLRYVARRIGGLRWWPRYARVMHELDKVVMPLIADRRSDPETLARTDVLSLLLCAAPPDGTRHTDEEVRDDLVTLMLAGHETTATTLAWLFSELVHAPAALERIRAEAVGAGEAPYTEAVIQETLRLHPPVPFTGRMTATTYELGDKTLAAGTHIVIYIDAINKDRRHYDRPLEFVPDRFLHQRPDTYAWLPFGGGIKRCVGARFSIVELTTVIHAMVLHGHYEAVGDPEPGVRRSVVVVPRNGARVVYRPRASTLTAAG